MLPGAMPETIGLMENLAELLALDEEETIVHPYLFWREGVPNIEAELAALGKQKFDIVIAKSLGTLIFAQAVFKQTLTCKKAVLLGVPLPVLRQMQLPANLFKRIKLSNILFVSQTHDKLCPSADIEQIHPHHMLTIAGEDHLYKDTSLYIDKVQQFLFSQIS